MPAIFSFRSIENKHDAYRGKACKKTFCGLLKIKVKDQYRYTWKYGGALHSICNLKYIVP